MKLRARAIFAQLFHVEIPNAIVQLQSDNCSIADATEIWIKLGENLELQNSEQVVKERIQMAITRYQYITYWQI